MNDQYDENNVFAKILRGDIPCKSIKETDYSLALYDINPRAPVHILVIPKGKYVNYNDFISKSLQEEREDFFLLVHSIAKEYASSDGFRIVSNNGADGGQEVPHLHFHILSGKVMEAL